MLNIKRGWYDNFERITDSITSSERTRDWRALRPRSQINMWRSQKKEDNYISILLMNRTTAL